MIGGDCREGKGWVGWGGGGGVDKLCGGGFEKGDYLFVECGEIGWGGVVVWWRRWWGGWDGCG